jgi:hypothetical protein
LVFNEVRDNNDDLKRIPKNPKQKHPKGNTVLLTSQAYSRGPGAGDNDFNATASELGHTTVEPAVWGVKDWHSLEIVVGPDHLTAFFDGQLVADAPVSASVENLGRALDRLRGELPREPTLRGVSPEFQYRGSLGLLVSRASAYIRSARLEPLTKK